MEYALTKDNAILKVYPNENDYKRYQLADSRFEIGRDQIVKLANTVEGLCDYLVYYSLLMRELVLVKMVKIEKIPERTCEEYIRDLAKCFLAKDIRLAIETDEGLIYVADVNEEGEVIPRC